MFDLPIAVGLIAAQRDLISPDVLNELAIMGELSLDGSLRPVRGVLPMVVGARESGTQAPGNRATRT